MGILSKTGDERVKDIHFSEYEMNVELMDGRTIDMENGLYRFFNKDDVTHELLDTVYIATKSGLYSRMTALKSNETPEHYIWVPLSACSSEKIPTI